MGRQRKRRETTTEQSESGDWLPAQDDFQLAAVELPSVGQAHDALLVARQALHIYLLEDRRDNVNRGRTAKALLRQFPKIQLGLSQRTECKQ